MYVPIHLSILILCVLASVRCESPCNNYHKSCGSCISYASEECVWFEQDDFPHHRCQPKNYVDNSDRVPYNHSVSKVISVKNEDFSENIQFRPQKLKILARPGVPNNFSMTYKPAKNFPLDVYFLLDYSYTMKTHKEQLQNHSLQIHDAMKKLTNNVRMGVGSFVEKPALPFADIVHNKHYSYAFKNHLSLTNDMAEFQNVIKQSKFGSNFDDAEAGFDALMQVMTCEHQIGWRNETRRIIVLATDSTYHSAGDGRMIGAVKPNDMKCHLVDNEYDTKTSLTYDYPSVSQINKVATDGKFKIIFAALKQVQDVYEALAKQITGSKYAELKNDTKTSNIVDIIKAEYEESVKYIKLDSTKSSSAIDLHIDQNCEDNPKKQRNCQSSPESPEVSIPASITTTKCPALGEKYTVTISPLNFDANLNIELVVDCQCECEKNSPKTPSAECNNAGIKQCGVCACNADRGGINCELHCSDATAMNHTACYAEKDATKACNGHGTCSCGKCECAYGFSGDYCQYSIYSCDKAANGQICAGDNGKCNPITSKCECNREWEGGSCECPVSKVSCIGPLSDKVCSGRGSCNCGKCVCDASDNGKKYMGMYCDTCESCAQERCKELETYAYCNHSNNKTFCDDQLNEKFRSFSDSIYVIHVNKTEFNSLTYGMATKCKMVDDDGKLFFFKYQGPTNTEKNLQLILQNELEDPPEANIWIAVGIAIITVLLIGIFTAIIWKVLINMYDKREYEKFCNEAKTQGYDVSTNPLYRDPTQSFANPMLDNSEVVQRNVQH